MRHPLPALAVLLLAAGCLSAPRPGRVARAREAVWAVDLVRTLPGRQAEYLRNIEANWAQGRRIARGRGVVFCTARSPPRRTRRGGGTSS